MADPQHAPKPLPPEPHWPVWLRVQSVLLTWITWPWQVRELKRAGFRRLGWMTWEARPDSELTDDQRAFISRRLGEL